MESYNLWKKPLKSISKEETMALFKENTEEAKKKIFEGNLAIIPYLINKNFPYCNEKEKEDIFQAASVALWNSILNFDITKGFEFTTYASSMIIGAVKENNNYNSKTIKPTRKVNELSFRINRLQEEYYKYNNSCNELTVKQLSDLLNVTEIDIVDTINFKSLISLEAEAYTSSKGDSVLFMDIIKDSNFSVYDNLELKDIIERITNNLSARDKKVINYYLGFGVEQKNQVQISEEVEVSQPQISRIINKFKKTLAEELGYKNIVLTDDEVIKENKNDKKIYTIYEKLSFYDSKLVDEELDRLEETKRIILLSRYPKEQTKKLKELTSEEKETANLALNQLTFSLALNYVRKMGDKCEQSNIVNINKEEIKMKKNEIKVENTKLTKEFISLFSNYDEEKIIIAFNKIQKRQKEILNLAYGLNNNTILSYKLIAEKFDIKEKSVSQQIYLAKRKMNEILLSLSDVKHDDINENKETYETIQNINNDKYVVEEKNSYNINLNNYADSVASIINLIKEGKFNASKINNYNDMFFGVEVFQVDCDLAHANTTMLYLDTNRAIKKKCYMYKIVIMDKNKKIIEQKVLIKEKNEKKFYECIYKDELGLYDFGNLECDCIVCFNIENEEKLKVEVHNELNEKESNKKPLIYHISSIYNEAVDCFGNREYNEAEEKFNKLFSLTTDESILYNVNVYLARIYNKKKKFIIAESYYKKAIELQKDYFILIELIGILCYQDKFNEALEICEECDKLKSNHTLHLVEKAKIYNLKGNTKLAIEILDNCISYNDNNYNAHLKKAEILFELNDYSKALDEVKKCEEIKPGMDHHNIIKGKIKYNLGDVEEAILIFDKCVENNIERNVMYTIIKIGYFFHKLGEEQLAYKYYNRTPMFPKWCDLTQEQINNHYKKHKENKYNEKMHSIFNVDISIEEISELVLKMNKTGVKELYDIYQIYWPNVGYMQIDEQKTVQEDYLTIYTLPFSKKVMMCHPDFKFSGKIINEPVSREDLEKHPEQKQDENIKLNNDLEKNDIVEEQLLDDRIDEQVSNNIKHDEILKQEDKKEEVINMDNILIEDCINIISLLKNPIYSKFVEKFNPKELLIVLLKLGYVDDNYFSTNEIAAFLNVDEKTIEELTKNALGACKEIINNYVDAAFDKLINDPKILEKK